VETGLEKVEWRLSDGGMDLLERAGLAALFMSLKAAEESQRKAELSLLRWEASDLTSESVTLRWEEGTAIEAFTKLFKWAWQVNDGVLYLPAVHRDALQAANWHRRIPIHSGILGTFLQHRAKVQKAGKPLYRIVTLDEGREIRHRYEPLKQAELAPLKGLAEVFKTGFNLDEDVRLASWVKPGCTTRYPTERTTEMKGDWQLKPWKGPKKHALLLMLCPIACWYMRLPSQQSKKKNKQSGEASSSKKSGPKWFSNWVMIIPDVRNLEEASDGFYHARLDLSFIDVASLGDAALRFVAKFATDDARRRYHVGCRAIAMGRVSYYPNQNVRRGILDFSPELGKRRRYRILHNHMDNVWVPPKETVNWENETRDDAADGEVGISERPVGFIGVPSGRGRIADNLIADRAWYADLVVPLDWQLDHLEWQRKKRKESEDPDKETISIECLWFENLRRQAAKLRALSSEAAMWDSDDERIFLRVMHDMLSTLIWKEKEALLRGGTRTLSERVDNLIEKIRRDLENAKTQTLLRDTLSKWLVKGGAHDTIRQNRAKVWGLMNHLHDWQKARDLARLALITYESKSVVVSAEPDWSVLGEELQTKLDFDSERNRLRFIGAMTEAERDALQELFTATEDQNALDDLYRKSQEI
jgi:CRISPR-associated protein Cas8a1/Csx13